jgi:chemotaxis signal transduction protein
MISDSVSAILGVWAGKRRYAIAQGQVDHLGLLDRAGAPTDQRGRPLICRELGALFGEAETAGLGRRPAITVSLRRRSVAILVDHIDSLGDGELLETHPLSPLIARRLRLPWFLGAVIYQDEPLLLLDLRRIANDVAIGAV